jgi:mannosylglucosylglycerate synthase
MKKFNHNRPGLFGISFDAVPMSGVIVEFLKIADIFHRNKYNIFLDLGYEIKADKNNFFKHYSTEKLLFPSWVNLIKIISKPFENYSKQFVESIFNHLIRNESLFADYEDIIDQYVEFISERLVNIWRKLNIKIVIIENGTLPENVIFTKAIYKAINIYGYEEKLGKYVIWRDHDFMWSSESNLSKYGKPPYSNVPLLMQTCYISHTVLHQADYDEALKWSRGAEITILENEFKPKALSISVNEQKRQRRKFRKLYHIPGNAYLIARFTRIIPQKRIDRDICLLHHLQQKFRDDNRSVYLCIAGDPNENIAEFDRLRTLIKNLNLSEYIIFTGTLKPTILADNEDLNNIQSLILASDICSFLTSFNYESFGNPISEAISLGRPFITTTYERYQHVYADAGYEGVTFRITHGDNCDIDESFVSNVYELLLNDDKKSRIVNHNLSIMKKRYTSTNNLKQNISKLLKINLA